MVFPKLSDSIRDQCYILRYCYSDMSQLCDFMNHDDFHKVSKSLVVIVVAVGLVVVVVVVV